MKIRVSSEAILANLDVYYTMTCMYDESELISPLEKKAEIMLYI